MTSKNSSEEIFASSSFKRLVSTRSRIRFSLSVIVIACHAFFVGGIAFYRDFFATPISSDSTVTLGIVFAAFIIVAFIVLEWVYIRVSETRLAKMQQDVLEQAASND